MLQKEKLFIAIISALAVRGAVLMLSDKILTKKENQVPAAVTYSDQTEHTIKQIVKTITGEEADVFLTYESSSTTQKPSVSFQTEQTAQTGCICGVAVFCKGGENPAVQLRIMRLLRTTLRIGCESIYIGEKTSE